MDVSGRRLPEALSLLVDVLTTPTDTGNGGITHPFFRAPHTVEDMVADRDAIAAWARMSYGWMGRSPDYKAMAFRSATMSSTECGARKNGWVTPPLPVSVGTVRTSWCAGECSAS